MTIWDCQTHVHITSMTSSVELTDLDFKISVALTVMILSFWTDKSGQIQIRLPPQDLHCPSVCIFWTYYCMSKPHCSKFRMIKAIFGCPNFSVFVEFTNIFKVHEI